MSATDTKLPENEGFPVGAQFSLTISPRSQPSNSLGHQAFSTWLLWFVGAFCWCLLFFLLVAGWNLMLLLVTIVGLESAKRGPTWRGDVLFRWFLHLTSKIRLRVTHYPHRGRQNEGTHKTRQTCSHRPLEHFAFVQVDMLHASSRAVATASFFASYFCPAQCFEHSGICPLRRQVGSWFCRPRATWRDVYGICCDKCYLERHNVP